jgi:DNA-directed RNA polymerase sigma subunit (sigma70/sigma32)
VGAEQVPTNDMAKALGISRERVRQIEYVALQKIRDMHWLSEELASLFYV